MLHPAMCTKLPLTSTVVHTPWGLGGPVLCAKFLLINVSVRSIFGGIGIILFRTFPVLAPMSWPLVSYKMCLLTSPQCSQY
jgi:hypothetical protein